MAKVVAYEIRVNGVERAITNTKELRDANRELKDAILGVERGTEAYDQLAKEQAQLSIIQKQLRDDVKKATLEMTAAGDVADIAKNSYRALEAELRLLDQEYKKLGDSAEDSARKLDIRQRTKAIRDELKKIDASMGVYVRNVGNYASAWEGLGVASFRIASIIGVASGLDDIVRVNAEVSDSIADVAKTSGLALEDVQKLADALKFRDTRTSLADQLDIAQIGGRLAIPTDELVGFVDAIDKANVALGDQFNNNAEEVTNVLAGLRNVLTDFQTDDTATDILRIGNALNVLETQGTATAPKIADLVNRIGGIAGPLGASTESIFGLATTLDELQISAERGGTAVTKLLTRLAATPDVFGQLVVDAGLLEDTEKFIELVETDIVSALGLVTQAAQQSSDTNVEFARILGDIGITGSGVTEVFAKLGSATQLLEDRTQTAADALGRTDSLIEEFEKKNENFAASLDKVRNAFVNFVVQSDIQTGLSKLLNGVAGLINNLSRLPAFIRENRVEIGFLALGILALNTNLVASQLAAIKASQAYQLMTSSTARAALATQLYSRILKSLPLLAVVSAVFGLVKAFQALNRDMSATAKASRLVRDLQKDIAKEAAAEQRELDRLVSVLKDNTSSIDDRREALEELQRLYPDYFRNFDIEKTNVSELDELQRQLNESILQGVAARKKAEALDAIYGEILEKQLRIQEIENEGVDALGFVERQDRLFGNPGESGSETAVRRAVEGLREEIALLQEDATATADAFDNLFETGSSGRSGRRIGGSVGSSGQTGTATGDDPFGGAADDAASSLESLRKRQSELQEAIQESILTGQPYGAQLEELRQVQDTLNVVQERYNRLLGGEQQAAEGSLEALRKRRAELQDQLDGAVGEAEITSAATELAALDAQIAQRESDIAAIIAKASGVGDKVGLSALQARLSEIDDAIQNTDNEAELRSLLLERAELSEQVSLLEARIENIRLQVGQTYEERSQAERDRQATDAEYFAKVDKERLDKKVADEIAAIEAARDAEILAAQQNITDAEERSQRIKEIETDARLETIDALLALEEVGSAEYLSLLRERMDIEQEMEDENIAQTLAKRQALYETLVGLADLFASNILEIEKANREAAIQNEFDALDAEYERKKEAAEGNAELQEQLDEEYTEKRNELEKKAAQERKEIARKEAIIKSALAILAALASGNPAAAISAFVAGATQLAVIESTTFAEGGWTGFSSSAPDHTGQRPAGTVHEDEYVIPRPVLRDPLARPYVYALEKIRLAKGLRSNALGYYAEGGLTNSVAIPQAALASQSVAVRAEVVPTEEFTESILQAVREGSKAGSREGSTEGLTEASRRQEASDYFKNRSNF